jgi:hypothetical protein
VISAALTIAAVAIWVEIMLDEWSGFVARGGLPGAVFAGGLCPFAPTALVWGAPPWSSRSVPATRLR